jgi:transcription initiation factor TFIID subunit TAF12
MNKTIYSETVPATSVGYVQAREMERMRAIMLEADPVLTVEIYQVFENAGNGMRVVTHGIGR